MKKILLTLLFLAFGVQSSFANDLIFYGDKDASWFSQTEESEVQASIDSIQSQYGLNMDMVILGANDEKGCYREVNIDSCVQEKYSYASDLLVVVKMKSSSSSNGDIRSLIKDDIKTIISTSKLKSIQDNIISYFKVDQFSQGLVQYNNQLAGEISNYCDDITGGKDCNIFTLAGEYESYKNKQKMYKIGIYVLFATLLVLTYYGFKWYYISGLRRLYKDLLYRRSNIEHKELFDESKNDFEKWYQNLINTLEKYLADIDKNVFKVKKVHKESYTEFYRIEQEIAIQLQNYSEQEKISKDLDNFKNIDL